MINYGTTTQAIKKSDPVKPQGASKGPSKPPTSGVLPKLPSDMKDKIARAIWRNLGPMLEDAGHIAQIDVSAFRRYCETYSLYIKANDETMEKGEYITTRTGYQTLAPWSIARDRHTNTLLKLEAKLLLTPDARIKARVNLDEAETVIDLEE